MAEAESKSFDFIGLHPHRLIQRYGTKRAEAPAPESLLSIERLSDSWCSGPADKIARC